MRRTRVPGLWRLLGSTTPLAALLLASAAIAQEPPAEPAPQTPPDPAPPQPPTAAPSPAPPTTGGDATAAAEGEITELPALLQQVEAEYPQRAQAEGVEAEVVLQIDIDVQGQVEGVAVLTPATPAGYGFDEAAIAAVSQFAFSPAMAGDTPVPVRITYRYRFTLAAPAPAPTTAEPPAASAPPAPRQPADAPVVNFSGQLIERGTRAPLAGEVVTVFRGSPTAPEQAFETATDAEGRFRFYDLAPGRWNLLMEAEGYFPLRVTETITTGELTDVRYYVERGSYNPYDVLVEAQRARREVSRTSLQIEQIERIPGTFGDVLAVVQNLPGVARPAPLSGEIIVRGAAPEDTQVVVEGMSIPIIYHFGGLRSVIPTPMLDGIDFYPGNFGPEYGRAIGGIVDVRLKRLDPERVGGILDVSVLDTNLYVEAPIGDEGAIAAAVRRSYIDFLIDAAVGGSDDVNLITAPRYYDAQLLAQYRPADGHELSAFALLSDDEFKLLFENPGEGDVRLDGNRLRLGIHFYRAILGHTYTPSERFQNELRLSYGEDDTGFELAQFEFNVDMRSLQLREEARWTVSEAFDLVGGIDYIYSDLSYRVFLPPPPREGAVADPRLEDAIASEISGKGLSFFGAFLQSELKPVPRLSIIPGLRFDHYPSIEEVTLAPRLTTRVQVHAQWTAKGGVGLYYQEPPIDETDPVFGNPEIGPEGAVHYSAGVEYRPVEHLTVDVTGFYKTLFDLVAPSEEIVERDGELVDERVNNTGEGRVFGAELLVRHDMHDHFSGWVAYTLMRSERRDRPGDPLRLFSQDQTHILTAVGTYQLPRNWEIGVRWRLVSGNPDTPIVGAVFNADLDEYEPIFGRINADRIPPFHQLDLRVDKKWIWPELTFTLYLDVQNVYNRANPEGKIYSFDYSESELIQGLPVIVLPGLRLEY